MDIKKTKRKPISKSKVYKKTHLFIGVLNWLFMDHKRQLY